MVFLFPTSPPGPHGSGGGGSLGAGTPGPSAGGPGHQGGGGGPYGAGAPGLSAGSRGPHGGGGPPAGCEAIIININLYYLTKEKKVLVSPYTVCDRTRMPNVFSVTENTVHLFQT